MTWDSASFTVHGSRVGGRGTRRLQSAACSRATRRSSSANSRRVRATTSLRVCRMVGGELDSAEGRGDLRDEAVEVATQLVQRAEQGRDEERVGAGGAKLVELFTD